MKERNLFNLSRFFIFLVALGAFVTPMILPTVVFALAIDEKLPLRIIETSDSKKTILINRGVEDGLVVGDHARFFISTGMVARGILLEASPSRSVWSLYKVANEEDLERDKVMNLKITEAVPLTEDPTKMLKNSDLGLSDESEEKDALVLSEGPDDYPKKMSEADRIRLERIQNSLEGGAVGVSEGDKVVSQWSGISNQTLDLWGVFYMDSMSSTSSLGSDQQGSNGKTQSYNAMIGLEKYFLDPDAWYSNISFSPFFHYGNEQYSSLEGHEIGTSFMGLGLNGSYHLFSSPLYFGKPLFYFNGSYGMGEVKEHKKLNNVSNDEPSNLKGSYSFFSLGAGLKYFFKNGLGFRILFDYYQRAEVYKVETGSDKYTKEVKGPRLLIGLSYRW